MAHAIWSGSINFGLVTIPVKLFTAVRTSDLRFNFLHKTDEGRINNVRRCAIDGEEVAYGDLVRGFEYEKGRYVIISDEDLKSVNVEATQSVDIVEFVDLAEIDPIFFDVPYYLEPEKKGRHAYALLREALKEANKVGIARVVIRSREHLAALKPNGEALVLELMHWADEIVEPKTFDFPALKEDVAPAEMKVAKMLIDTMAASFEPEKYHDRYREAVMAMIEARATGAETPAPEKKAAPRSNVVNLMDILQKSLDASKGKGRTAASDDDDEDADSGARSDGAKAKGRKKTTAAPARKRKSTAA
jgi:DNA end-binding protein Ku